VLPDRIELWAVRPSSLKRLSFFALPYAVVYQCWKQVSPASGNAFGELLEKGMCC